MTRVLITTLKFFCPQDSFCTCILSTFNLTAFKETKLYCHVSVFHLQSRGLHLLQHLQNPTCQQLPCLFSAVKCPHKLFLPSFFQILCSSSQAFFLFSSADRQGPKDSQLCYCCSAPLLMQLFSHNSSLEALDPQLNSKILQQTNSDSCKKSHETRIGK